MLRTFIGIPVDGHSQQLVNDLLEPLTELPLAVRWEAERNRHLTLAFLGNRPIGDIENLLGLVDEIYADVKRFQFELSSLRRFPGVRGRFITLVGSPNASLENLYQITRSLLENHGIEIERRAFRPHVTVGRINRPGLLKQDFEQQTTISLDVSRVVFYLSTLTNAGSIYSPLADIQLKS